MASHPEDSPFPAYGSRVGPWIVGKRLGTGSYGRVFQAVHQDRPEAGTYALKVASRACDERFEREAHLLSCVRHSSVPRLEDRGTWTSPEGEDYPYLVMEWAEGVSLYSWALENGLTLRQAIGQLAQVARALQATHAHGVHRDVKGGNVRVSPEGKAVLLDFGSCWYPEASPLTGSDMPPGTDNYRSPQQLMYAFALERGWPGAYDNSPADDLYALGVTAYRLLSGGYPPRLPDNEDGSQKPVRLKAPRGLQQVCPEMGELIERLLAEDPLERGSASEVAEELEALLEYSRPELNEPWVAAASRPSTAQAKPPTPRKPASPPEPLKPVPPPAAPQPAPAPAPPPLQPAPPPVSRENAGSELTPLVVVTASFVVLMLLCLLLTRNVVPQRVASTEPESESQAAEQPDAGTALGEEGMASVSPAETPPAPKEKISNSTNPVPDKPEPGQKTPPCNRPDERAINGGCWAPLARKPPCDDFYEHDGECYAPVRLGKRRLPTSDDP